MVFVMYIQLKVS